MQIVQNKILGNHQKALNRTNCSRCYFSCQCTQPIFSSQLELNIWFLLKHWILRLLEYSLE